MTEQTLYREIILEECRHPKNKGRIPDADREASCSNPLCGDELKVTLLLDKADAAGQTDADGLAIADVRFEGTGCAISQASASLYTEYIKGRTLAEVARMDENEIVRLLGVTPNPMRMKCAVLIMRCVAKALEVE